MSDTTSLSVTRLQRTHDRIAHGELPEPKDAKLCVGSGCGTPCNGCGETITETEREYELVFGDTTLRFHAECFGTWAKLTAVNRA